MGNDKSKPSSSSKSKQQNSISKKDISKKLQQDLNQKFEKINRMMEKVMNVPIENSQYRNNLNENYQMVQDFLRGEYQNFKQNKSLMFERKTLNINRIASCFEQLFNKDERDSLPQIFQNSKIQEKITMTERKKLMIFYHITVLDKYQRTMCGGEQSFNGNGDHGKNAANSKLYETTEELRKKQRKELRAVVMNIIKDDNYFVVNPTLQRFNQIMENAFYKDFKDKVYSNDTRSLQDFMQKLVKRLSKEEADFIFYSFQLITIVLTQNIYFLLQKIVQKFIPEVFQGASDLYEQIFCGQIVEKLLFRTKNRILLQAAIQVSFIQTNQMKPLNLDFDDRELAEFLQERSMSMQQFTMNPMSFAEVKQSMFNGPTLNNNISSNMNVSNNNPDFNRGNSIKQKGTSRERSNEKKSKMSQEQKTNANIKMIKQYANSRESFIVRNQQVQLRRHTFSQVSEALQQEKLNGLDCIQEEAARQSQKYNESIFSDTSHQHEHEHEEENKIELNVHDKNQQKEIQIHQQVFGQNETQELPIKGEEPVNEKDIVIIEDDEIERSHLSAQFHLMANEENTYNEVTTDIRKSRRDTTKSSEQSNPKSNNNLSEVSSSSQSEASAHSLSKHLSQNDLKEEEEPSVMEKLQSYDNQQNKGRDTFYGKDREVFYDRNRDTLHKMRIEKERGFSQCLKNYLQEKYKKYLDEIFTLLEECLNEKSFFKKIKKAFKFVIRVQDRFAKNSVNFQASAHFIEEKDNWYPIICMILKSYLTLKPEGRLNLYYLCSVIKLITQQEIEGTHLQDFQEHLRSILKLNDTTESNLQSQVMTPIQFSEINNMEPLNDDDINMKDGFDFYLKNRNSISGEQSPLRIMNNDNNNNINKNNMVNPKESFLKDQSYMNENSLIKTSTQ